MDGPSCLYGNYANVSDDSFETEKATNPEILGLNKLSSSLEKLLTDSNEYDYSDADIVVEGVGVGVHRCILAVRNGYFHELFKNWDGEMGKGSRPLFKLNELVPDGVAVGYDAFRAVLRYIYTGKLEPCPAEVSTCVDDTCPHDSCRPAIDYVVELMYASATFQIKELVMVFQRRAMSFIDKAFIEDIIPITLLAFRCKMELLFTRCIQRLVQSGLNNVFLEEELPPEVSGKIKMLRLKSKLDGQSNAVVTDTKNEELDGHNVAECRKRRVISRGMPGDRVNTNSTGREKDLSTAVTAVQINEVSRGSNTGTKEAKIEQVFKKGSEASIPTENEGWTLVSRRKVARRQVESSGYKVEVEAIVPGSNMSSNGSGDHKSNGRMCEKIQEEGEDRRIEDKKSKDVKESRTKRRKKKSRIESVKKSCIEALDDFEVNPLSTIPVKVVPKPIEVALNSSLRKEFEAVLKFARSVGLKTRVPGEVAMQILLSNLREKQGNDEVGRKGDCNQWRNSSIFLKRGERGEP